MYVTFNDILKDATSKFNKYTDTGKVYEAICMIDEASSLTRREGLLALEDAFAHGNSKTILDDIAFGIMMIVDGTEPAIVMEVLTNDYWANKYEGNDALKQYILMRGILSIQEGENPRIISEILMSTLPRELRDECDAILEKARIDRKVINDKKTITWYENEWKPIFSEDEEIQDIAECFQRGFASLNSDEKLKFMINTSFDNLVVAFAICSKDFHKLLRDNMSRRLFLLAAEDLRLDIYDLNHNRLEVYLALNSLRELTNKVVDK